MHAVRIDDLAYSHTSGHLDEKALRRWFQWPLTLGLHLKVDGMCTGLRPVLQAEPWRYDAPATLFPPGDGIPEDHIQLFPGETDIVSLTEPVAGIFRSG